MKHSKKSKDNMVNYLIIGLIAVIVIIFFVGLFSSVKKSNDIRKMKQFEQRVAPSQCGTKDTSRTFANCYINELINEFGLSRTKDLFYGKVNPSDKENKFMESTKNMCVSRCSPDGKQYYYKCVKNQGSCQCAAFKADTPLSKNDGYYESEYECQAVCNESLPKNDCNLMQTGPS